MPIGEEISPSERLPNEEYLKRMRDVLLSKYAYIEFYQYQRECSDVIIDSIANNKGMEIYLEFSRQSGKTTLVAMTAYTIALTYWRVFNKPIRIGIFAPTYRQTNITFNRLRDAFNPFELGKLELSMVVNNGDTVVLSNKDGLKIATIMSITASKDTTIKGETFDLIICEECQDINDRKIKEDILPMGAATNATNVFIGTPALQSHQKFFYEGLLTPAPKRVRFVNDFRKALEFNPKYQQHIDWAIDRYGADSPEFRSQYILEWVLESTKFIPPEKLYKLRKDYERIKEKKDGLIYVGIDVAKEPDSTVVTVISYDNNQKSILNWMELHGDNYEDQVDIIMEFLSHYEVKRIMIDSVGVGDPVYDFIKRKTRVLVEGFKWSATSHHDAFKYLWAEMHNGRLWYPAGVETQKALEFKRFEHQFMDLNKEYRGNLMSCHHPEETNAHDDYCSSLCLAVIATRETQTFTLLPDMSKFFDGEYENKEDWK